MNRLHSGLNPFNTREPWRFSAPAERVMKEFLRLRHQLLPYLATMNLRAHDDGQPLVQPMYYQHPEEPEAYECPNQFMFGSELLVAPITSPLDKSTGLGRVRAWLPESEWVDIFTGLTYTRGRTIYLHRDLTSIPVLARAGGIIPMAPSDGPAHGTDLPELVDVHVYPGADGEFTLVEDRGDELWAHTRTTYDDRTGHLTIHDALGNTATIPANRTHLPGARRASLLDDAAAGVRGAGPSAAGLPTEGPRPQRRVHHGNDRLRVLALQGLDLSPVMLGAVTEILLSR